MYKSLKLENSRMDAIGREPVGRPEPCPHNGEFPSVQDLVGAVEERVQVMKRLAESLEEIVFGSDESSGSGMEDGRYSLTDKLIRSISDIDHTNYLLERVRSKLR